ncbi:MAG: hypothetical protein ACN4GM_15100 [Gammaproteobacteria bacterium]
MKKFTLHWITISLLVVSGVANAGPHDNKVLALLQSDASAWLSDPLLIEAVKRQNAQHASLTQRDIDRLDKTWRSENKSSDQPTIDSVLKNKLSVFLQNVANNSNGLYSEIIIMDNKGLNVGQSKISSDFWQGDEAKWQKTFLAGPQALYIDKIEYDDSSHSFQIQASVPVIDPATKANIGAVTIGLAMRQLALRQVK